MVVHVLDEPSKEAFCQAVAFEPRLVNGNGAETRMQLGSEVEIGGSLFRCIFIDPKHMRITLQFLGTLNEPSP